MKAGPGCYVITLIIVEGVGSVCIGCRIKRVLTIDVVVWGQQQQQQQEQQQAKEDAVQGETQVHFASTLLHALCACPAPHRVWRGSSAFVLLFYLCYNIILAWVASHSLVVEWHARHCPQIHYIKLVDEGCLSLNNNMNSTKRLPPPAPLKEEVL